MLKQLSEKGVTGVFASIVIVALIFVYKQNIAIGEKLIGENKENQKKYVELIEKNHENEKELISILIKINDTLINIKGVLNEKRKYP